MQSNSVQNLMNVLWAILCLGFGAFFVGCQHYERPNRPLPEDFSLVREDGTLLQKDDFLGHPWVINIWLPGCHICARELPEVETLRLKYERQGVRFLSLSLVPDKAKNKAFLQRLGVEMPLVMAKDEVLLPLGVNQTPSTVFINRAGVIVRAAKGPRSPRSMAERIEELVRN